MIPVSSAISVNHPMVHHKVRLSRSLALPEASNLADRAAKRESDLGHISQWAAGGATGRPEVPCQLIQQHGADMRLPDLREILADDCPPVRAASFKDRCAAHY